MSIPPRCHSSRFWGGRRFASRRFADRSPLMAAAYALIALALMAGGRAQMQAASVEATRSLPRRVTFNAHIRPIMSNTCFLCHGPDDEDNASGFRIDSFAAATSSLPSDEQLVGIKPGNPRASEVYLRIMGLGDGAPMPPEDFRHQLTDYDKALFRKWIEQGAEYEQHWAYAPLKRPAVPQLPNRADQIANPIDAFLLERLEREGLEPSEMADKAALLRRLSLDLIGLPPTLAELTAFLNDSSNDGYQRQVERLLSSRHFGERMASSWLDVVKFADTVGFHGDQNQRIFPYRDYVIDAFNDNKPFDQFTREQIAGDLLPNPTDEQLTATGVLRLNMMTREGGAQPKEYLAKYRAERVRMLGTAWLGATLACCECHNHKYDPFTTKDFYSLGTFFDDVRQWGVYADYGYTPNPDLRGFNNDFPFPPELRVASPSLCAEIRSLERERDEKLFEQLGADSLQSAACQAWLQALVETLQDHPDGWAPLEIAEASASGTTLHEKLEDGSLLFTGNPDASEVLTVATRVPRPILANAIRLEVLPDERNGGRVGRGEQGRFSVSLSAKIEHGPGYDQHEHDKLQPAGHLQPQSTEAISIAWAQADRQNPPRYESGQEPLLLGDVWRAGPAPWQLPLDETSLPHTAVYHFERPVRIAPDERLVVTLKSGDIGRVRLSVTPLGHALAGWPAADRGLHEALETKEAERTEAQQAWLVSAFHRSAHADQRTARHEPFLSGSHFGVAIGIGDDDDCPVDPDRPAPGKSRSSARQLAGRNRGVGAACRTPFSSPARGRRGTGV